jgi:hypothetical protein
MKLHLSLALLLSLLVPNLHSAEATETKTLTVEADVEVSQSLSLNAGDRLELVSAGISATTLNSWESMSLVVTGDNWSQEIPVLEQSGDRAPKKIVLAGPLKLSVKAYKVIWRTAFATFDIHRAGAPSNAVPIPQEAGSNFNVILEQSSDLLNWTPANPGTYAGTEPKRFFRTRIVRMGQ